MYRYSSNHHNRNYYRKPLWRTTGFYVLLFICAIIAIFIYWSIGEAENQNLVAEKAAEQAGAPILSAKLIFIEGKVELRNSNGSTEEIGVDYQIKPGDTVKTSTNAKAVIELPDKSITRLSENAEIKFEAIGLADITLEQRAGHIFHRVNTDSTAIYRVNNGTAELTALGTGFDVLVSGDLTYLTVTESRVKVKIFAEIGSDTVTNMRTVEQGTKAVINTTLAPDKTITTETANTNDLQNDGWLAWNLEQDRAAGNYLGIFASSIKLVILEPKESAPSVDSDKIHLKGETVPGAQVFISGTELDNNNGVFESDIALSPGNNDLEITVKKDREQTKKTLTVISTKQASQINLTIAADKNTANLTWSLDKAAEFKEFKIVHSTESAPAYPAATYHTANKTTLTDAWPDLSKGKHYFRVCLFTAENKCASYSNEASVEIADSAAAAGQLTLTATAQGNSIKLNWTSKDENLAGDGFKTIIADKAAPAYPGNSYHSLAVNARNDIWKNLSPGTYHFRICLIKANECIGYSNDASAKVDANAVPRITLSGAADGGAIVLNWKAENFDAPQGFKVIMAETSNISGMGQNHHLLTSPTAASDIWDGLTSGTTYYFKVCQNLNGALGTCSNEIPVSF